jgi:hypothetical protein
LVSVAALLSNKNHFGIGFAAESEKIEEYGQLKELKRIYRC